MEKFSTTINNQALVIEFIYHAESKSAMIWGFYTECGVNITSIMLGVLSSEQQKKLRIKALISRIKKDELQTV